MKRFAILALLAAFVLSFAAQASAATDLEATGYFRHNVNWMGHGDNFQKNKNDGAGEDQLLMHTRARVAFRMIANENLWGVLEVQYNANTGANAGTADPTTALALRKAYLQFRIPSTEVMVTAGKQDVAIPGAVGGPVFLGDVRAPGFAVSAQLTDMIGLSAGWARLADLYASDNEAAGYVAGQSLHDESDAFFLTAPITIDGFSATPYFVYNNVGKDVNGIAAAGAKDEGTFWVGGAFSVDYFDPFTFNMDLIYGSTDGYTKARDAKGFFMDASLAYTGLDMFTPELLFAYSTGEDDDATDGSERMPIIVNDWAIGTFYTGGGDLGGSDLDRATVGFWALGVALKDISFMDKLTHDFYAIYFQGTNDKDSIAAGAAFNGSYLTSKDALYELDFNTQYQVFEELAAIVELGYIIEDIDQSHWRNKTGNNALKFSNAFKVAFGLKYDF